MAGDDDNGNTSAKNRQYSRKLGDRNEAQKERYASMEDAIKETWRLSNVMEAFPASIKPTSLGSSALANLKGIAARFPILNEAQALFIKEAKDAHGNAVPFGFTHSKNILAELLKAKTTTPNNTAEKAGKMVATTSMEKQLGSSKQSGSRKKGPKVPAIPDGLIAPGTKDEALFSLNSSKTTAGTSLLVDTSIIAEGSMGPAIDLGTSMVGQIASNNFDSKLGPASSKPATPPGFLDHRKRPLAQQSATAKLSDELRSPLPKKIKKNDENKPLAPQTDVKPGAEKPMGATKGQEIKSFTPETQPKVMATNMGGNSHILEDLAQKALAKTTSSIIDLTNLPEDSNSSPLDLDPPNQLTKLDELFAENCKKNEEFFKKMSKGVRSGSKELAEKMSKGTKSGNKELAEKEVPNLASILARFGDDGDDEDTIVVDYNGGIAPKPLNTTAPSGKSVSKHIAPPASTSGETVASANINSSSNIVAIAQEALSYVTSNDGAPVVPLASAGSNDLSRPKPVGEEALKDNVERLISIFPSCSRADAQDALLTHSNILDTAADAIASKNVSVAVSSDTANLQAPVTPTIGNGGPSAGDALFNKKLTQSLAAGNGPFRISPDRIRRSPAPEPGTTYDQGSMTNTMRAPMRYPAANPYAADTNMMGRINDQGRLDTNSVNHAAAPSSRAEVPLKDIRARDPGARTDLAAFCNYLNHQVRGLLDQGALAAFGAGGDMAAVDELKSVFATTVRHFESDTNFALSKSGKDKV